MTTPRKSQLDQMGVVLLLSCTIFWGFQQVLIKATLSEMAPVFQAGMRFMGATCLLLIWCRWRNISWWIADGSLQAGLLAGLLFAFEFACLYAGLQFTSVARLTIFLYTAPFWVALLLPLWVQTERLQTRQWMGLALAFAAVVVALQDKHAAPSGSQHWLGDLLALGAGLAWGLTTVTIRSTKLATISPEKLLLYQIGLSALCLPILSGLLGEPWQWRLSGFAWGSLLLQTVVGAFASYLTWMWMLAHYPVTKISAFTFLTPIFALVFGILWLKETVTFTLLGCLLLVMVGIVLVNRPAR